MTLKTSNTKSLVASHSKLHEADQFQSVQSIIKKLIKKIYHPSLIISFFVLFCFVFILNVSFFVFRNTM